MSDKQPTQVQQLAEATTTSAVATITLALLAEAENPGTLEEHLARETAHLKRHRTAEGIYG